MMRGGHVLVIIGALLLLVAAFLLNAERSGYCFGFCFVFGLPPGLIGILALVSGVIGLALDDHRRGASNRQDAQPNWVEETEAELEAMRLWQEGERKR